jgi:anti-sigma-K factor RskA
MSVPEPRMPHLDAAGWVLGTLEPHERESFEAHLAGCGECRRAVAELRRPADLLRSSAPPADLPAALRDDTLGAVEDAASAAAPRRARRERRGGPPWSRQPGLAIAGALAALVLAVVVAIDPGGEDGPELEVAATLRPPGGGEREARVEVVETGIGREITLRTDDLPVLPGGEYYELWFVGPGDSRARPNRISAGTFHPDENGRSNAEFTAAVDPRKYPGLSITAEPGDGNPARTGREILRARAR